MDRKVFYQRLRHGDGAVFGAVLTQQQVDGIEGILDAMAAVGDGRAKTLAYALATAWHETGRRMVPVREGFARSDQEAIKAVASLARRLGPGSAPERYGKPVGPYGKCYYGRGHVQLTWQRNYAASSADAGVDLERDPDRMLDPVVSARILILGLMDGRWNGCGKGIAHYLPRDGADNLKDARRTVNGTDRWDLVAGYYKAFLSAIQAAGGWQETALSRDDPDARPRKHATADPAGPATPAQDLAPTFAVADEPVVRLLAWLNDCPGEIRAVGAWLAAMPGTCVAREAADDTPTDTSASSGSR
ncbi:Chitinase class I [Paracoccus aminovorans]|uniref:Chitinase class I n=1 Tax=Paracoccus aminovorans TaxID=34004 RepID=A0A1I3F0S2_9RHOB|nr:glycoside hydrolase family 19 protein [Paracoccus aminovorans]CQR84923.1 hypothetical protein JCM7685_0339 [Paracoccus aminovorans]SFI04768.1 Chitinase class I [Paracoccus aminovorans]